MRHVYLGESGNNEAGQEREEPEHQDDLKAPGLLGPGQVQGPEKDGQAHGSRAVEPGGRVSGNQQRQVGPHPDQSERSLEDQRQPSSGPADGPRERPKASVQEVVGPAGTRHGRGQLGRAQHGGDEDQAGEGVGEHHRGSGDFRRHGRQQEETCGQGRPRGNGIDAKQSELLAEPLRTRSLLKAGVRGCTGGSWLGQAAPV